MPPPGEIAALPTASCVTAISRATRVVDKHLPPLNVDTGEDPMAATGTGITDAVGAHRTPGSDTLPAPTNDSRQNVRLVCGVIS